MKIENCPYTDEILSMIKEMKDTSLYIKEMKEKVIQLDKNAD
jgi:hypothetical protein